MVRFLALIFSLSFAVCSFAVETITINRGHSDPIPIAINNFDVDNGSMKDISEKIISIISNDLQGCGLFRTISRGAFIENKVGTDHKPLLATWRQISAKLLLNAKLEKLSSSRFKVSFILWDTVLEKDIAGEVLEFPSNMLRRVAHKISNKIYEKITGDIGYFDTQISYVSETGTYLKRNKRIAIMDYDGENHRYLTDGKHLVLTPRFSPKVDKVLYLSYAKKVPSIYMKDLKSGKNVLLGEFPGMSFSPRFSPDGSKALMSISRHGSTHIFEINFSSNKVVKLTSGPNINTSPSYSPDGTKIVFNSDRSGSRQLYIMNVDGSDVQRISFGGGSYASPSWSPIGDWIAFTKIVRGEGFYIGVMRPTIDSARSNERVIANGYLVEGPCWSPNGRSIMYTRGTPSRGNIAEKHNIYAIDLNGYNERLIKTPQDASDPDWSQNLQ